MIKTLVRVILSKSELTVFDMKRQFVTGVLLAATLFFSGAVVSKGQAGKAGANEQPQQTVQSVVAKQAALVSEFEVNGLKVLVKRREGSLTVAAGLFLRGGAANTSAQNAGIEQLMLNASTEASTGFPREKMRSELSPVSYTHLRAHE